MKVITTLTKEEWRELVKNGKLLFSELNNFKSVEFKKDLVEYFDDYLGIETKKPFLTVSKIDGNSITLEGNYYDIPQYIETFTNCIILELNVDNDCCVSFEFSDYLNNPTLARALKRNGVNVITIIPYIEKEWVKKCLLLNDVWDLDANVSDTETINKMVFDV